MEEQVPLNLPCSPCSECNILFPSQLHVLTVGRDTELQIQSDNSLNFECSGSSGHWVHGWSEAYPAKVIIERIASGGGMCVSRLWF